MYLSRLTTQYSYDFCLYFPPEFLNEFLNSFNTANPCASREISRKTTVVCCVVLNSFNTVQLLYNLLILIWVLTFKGSRLYVYFTVANATRFYLSEGQGLGIKGLKSLHSLKLYS